MPAGKRDHLIDTALRLFAAEGFHAVGIDRVIAEAGVAKMTLYNHFRTKDELIVAALERRAERFLAWFTHRVEAATEDPRQRLLTVFDVLAEWYRGRGPEPRRFTGCAFQNAAAEFHDPAHPAHAAANAMKRGTRGYVRGLAEAAGFDDPGAVAAWWLVLIEGATAVAHQLGERDAALTAKAAAATLLDAQAPS